MDKSQLKTAPTLDNAVTGARTSTSCISLTVSKIGTLVAQHCIAYIAATNGMRPQGLLLAEQSGGQRTACA